MTNRLDGKARAGMAFKFLAYALCSYQLRAESYGYSSNYTTCFWLEQGETTDSSCINCVKSSYTQNLELK